MTFKNPWEDINLDKEKKSTDSNNSDKNKDKGFFQDFNNFKSNNKKSKKNNDNYYVDWFFDKFINTPDLIKKFIAVVVVLYVATGFYVIEPEENAVILRFGKFNRIATSGLNYHLPYPFESAIKESVKRVRIIKIGGDDSVNQYNNNTISSLLKNSNNNQINVQTTHLMLTGDENIIDVSFEVQWKVNNLKNFIFNIKDRNNTIHIAAESVLREVIGKNNLASILTNGRAGIELDAKNLLQNILDKYNSGVEIILVQMLKADPPVQVIDSFRDVQTARVDKESEINKALAYESNVVPNARGGVGKIKAESESYAIKTINTAKGNTLRFDQIYEQYRFAPYLTRKRIYLETMSNIFQNSDITIIDESFKNVFLSAEKNKNNNNNSDIQNNVIGSAELNIK